jgi:hypothetical protein
MKHKPMKNHLDSNEKSDLSNESSEIIKQRMQDSLIKLPFTNTYEVAIRYESGKTDPQSVESLLSNIKNFGLKTITPIEVSPDYNQNKYPAGYVGEFKSYNNVKRHFDYFRIRIQDGKWALSEPEIIKQWMQDYLIKLPFTNNYEVITRYYESWKTDLQSVESLLSNIKNFGLKAITPIEVSLHHNQNKYPGKYVGEFKSYNHVKHHFDYFKIEEINNGKVIFISAHEDGK